MKNIIFDVGNVLVNWDPINIIKLAFPECIDPNNYLLLFKDIIVDLDAGRISFDLAKQKLQARLNTTKEKIENLFNIFFASLTLLPNSISLLDELAKNTRYSLYCLTNMSHECFVYLNKQYTFWNNFKGIVVSADVKLIKPDPRIYIYILNKYNLIPQETVFIDDVLENVIAARNLEIYGIHFTDFTVCKEELKKLGILK